MTERSRHEGGMPLSRECGEQVVLAHDGDLR
jgi:hypothetical protein